MVRVKIHVSMCGFPVDAGSNSSTGFLVVSRKAIDPSFSSCAGNLMCSLIEMVMELSEMRSGEAEVAVVVIFVPALRR